MAGSLPGVVSLHLVEGRAKIFIDIRKRMKAPMKGGGGLVVAHIMRQGPGSVDDQFKQSSEFTDTGAQIPWKKTQPFGNRPAPAKTLIRTGRLRAAWTGRGAGALTRITAKRVMIGPDPKRFPQAGMFQRIGWTIIRPKKMGKGGRTKMHWFLGMTYGVWISEARLKRGLRIEGRRVGVNPKMMKRASVALRDFLISGNASTAANI